jgi:tetratricopeptide (TPR) repeat protein
MEYLDIEHQNRDEYQDKLVLCNGTRYIVGEFIGVGAEKIVHKQVNEESHLALHVIKIIKIPRPIGLVSEMIAKMRANPELASLIPPILEFEVPGGLIEVQIYLQSSKDKIDRATEFVQDGRKIMQESDANLELAISRFQEALQIKSKHTEAMYWMSLAIWDSNDPFRAWHLIADAVDIEPNILKYWDAYIRLSVETDDLRLALQLYEHTKNLFYNIHDLDALGVELFLNSGNPESAKACLSSAILSAERHKELETQIDEACVAHASARKLMDNAKIYVEKSDWVEASKILLNAQRIYNRDPIICMNTAFAAYHNENPKLAAVLLMHAETVISDELRPTCLVNSAISLIKDGDLNAGITYLNYASKTIAAFNGGKIPCNQYDLPGIGIWVQSDLLEEEPIPSAWYAISSLFDNPTKELNIPQTVLDLADAYLKSAETYG